jgi:membrane-bound lytic murein transglycosylase
MGSGGPDYYLSDQSDFEENEMYCEEIKTWTKADGDPTEEMMRRWKHKLVWM